MISFSHSVMWLGRLVNSLSKQKCLNQIIKTTYKGEVTSLQTSRPKRFRQNFSQLLHVFSFCTCKFFSVLSQLTFIHARGHFRTLAKRQLYFSFNEIKIRVRALSWSLQLFYLKNWEGGGGFSWAPEKNKIENL